MTAAVHQTENLLFFVLLQLIVMIGAARLLNTVFRRLGQPGVIGEIIAGLALGPSLLGHFQPHLALALFGDKPAPAVTIISQIGLILLMFQIGADFHFAHLKTRRNAAAVVAVTLASVSVPLLLGVLVGQVSAPILAPSIEPLCYSLFMGVGLAITAVPILGRILRQYDLTRTELGVVAISAAAVNDVIGWVMLAGISAYALAQDSAHEVIFKLLGLASFAALLVLVLRPGVQRLLRNFPLADGEIPPNRLAIVICLVFALGMGTYKLGIFAIFGGFAAGLLFQPYGDFVAAWRRQVGGFVMVFFLPVFFTFTGLRTNVLGLTALLDGQ
jgi:Kef-type K+ transport system membrane component KefB